MNEKSLKTNKTSIVTIKQISLSLFYSNENVCMCIFTHYYDLIERVLKIQIGHYKIILFILFHIVYIANV